MGGNPSRWRGRRGQPMSSLPPLTPSVLWQGIPETAEPAPVVARGPTSAPPAAGTASPPAAGGPPAAVASPHAAAAAAGPNAAPLDLFPQGMPGVGGAAGAPGGAGALDFLRENPQFQALRQMVQANPTILQVSHGRKVSLKPGLESHCCCGCPFLLCPPVLAQLLLLLPSLALCLPWTRGAAPRSCGRACLWGLPVLKLLLAASSFS